jgi:phosphatidylserine/phosphatidylglycerophosphate/cardiolipin synthase-like enzyme
MEPSLASTGSAAPLLREAETCWQLARAERVAFLVDGEAYFPAVAAALERARHQVLMLGWDFHGRVRLRRGATRPGVPDDLLGLLTLLLRRRPDLRVHALGWGYGALRAFAREVVPSLHLGLRQPRGVEFRFDTDHPWLGCHHQKVIVVDDAVAFAGGFDVTASRWDSRAHHPDDARRTTPEGRRYAPFHDVQMAVDGEAAAALGTLARERWRRATGERLPPPPAGATPWPPGLAPAARAAAVGIARTEPAFGGRPAVREVEASYLACIAAARRWIYAENQYLTSQRVVDALCGRLGEPGGPEVVLVLPARCAWPEELAMGALRARALARLAACDRYRRLRVYHPRVGDNCVNVHAKVMVVDDALARVGSANLSNRSFGLDTECDLLLEARGRPDLARAVGRLRDDLLAEHLGAREEVVRAAIRGRGSLIGAVEALRGGNRSLEPLPPRSPGWLVDVAARLADPEDRPPRRAVSLRVRLVAAGVLLLLLIAGLLPAM